MLHSGTEIYNYDEVTKWSEILYNAPLWIQIIFFTATEENNLEILAGNWAFSQDFHPRKLSKVLVFYAVCICWELFQSFRSFHSNVLIIPVII